MPLSKPARRDAVHDRSITCRGYRREDGLWDIEGVITDTKAYTFTSTDRGHIAAGEPLHHMAVRLTIDDGMVVRAAEAVGEAGPYRVCGDITGVFDGLVGLQIGRGWRKAVINVMGRTKGCTHLTDLVMGPMAVTAYQTLMPILKPPMSPDADGPPPTLNTCHAMAEDGDVVQRLWPDFYKAPQD